MKIKLLGLAFASSLVLAACGGGDSGSSSVAATSLSKVAGVWDGTTTEDGKEDIYYHVFTEDGQWIGYDFLGDEYDNVRDCYQKNSGKITNLGNSNFRLEIGSESFESKINVNGDLMTFTYVENNTTYKDTMNRATKKESDFTPLCTIDAA